MKGADVSILSWSVRVGNYRVKSSSPWNSPFFILKSKKMGVRSFSAELAVFPAHGRILSNLDGSAFAEFAMDSL